MVQAVTGDFWTGKTSSIFSRKLDGIAAAATGGTFEVSLGDNAGEGSLLVFLTDAKTQPPEALSNLLRITLKIVDGESGYAPPAGRDRRMVGKISRPQRRSPASFSPDGKTLASAGADSSVCCGTCRWRSAALASGAPKGLRRCSSA
jgi:hypothetical protein